MPLARQAAVVVLSALLSACDFTFLVVSPGAVVVGVDLRLQPIAPFPQTVPSPTCPAVQPFAARFEVIVSSVGDRRIDHDLERIDVSYSDREGAGGPSMSLGREDIRRQFGSTAVSGSRSLLITHSFGCGTLSSGTIIVIIRAKDSNGAIHTARAELQLEGP